MNDVVVDVPPREKPEQHPAAVGQSAAKATPAQPSSSAASTGPPAWLRRLGSLLVPVLILAAAIGGMGYLQALKQPPPEKSDVVIPPLVNVAAVESGDQPFHIRLDGTVTSKEDVPVTAEIAGRLLTPAEVEGLLKKLADEIAAAQREAADRAAADPAAEEIAGPPAHSILKLDLPVDVRGGRHVQAGDVLFVVDPRRYFLEVRRLESEVRQAQSQLRQLVDEEKNQEALQKIAAKEVELAAKEEQRVLRLLEMRRVNDADYDQAVLALKRAENLLQQVDNALNLIPARKAGAQAMLELNQAKLDLARLDLQFAVIRAPVSGVISELSVEENAFVQPGQALAKVQDTSAVEVAVSLRQDDVPWLDLMDRDAAQNPNEIPRVAAEVIQEGRGVWEGREFRWHGFTSRYDAKGVNELTRTYPAFIEVPFNADQPRIDGMAFGPEMPVRGRDVVVEIGVTPQASGLLRVPEAALQPRAQNWAVWSVRESAGEGGSRYLVQEHPVQVVRWVASDDGNVQSASSHALVRQIDRSSGGGEGEGSRARALLSVGDRLVVPPFPIMVNGIEVRVEQPADSP